MSCCEILLSQNNSTYQSTVECHSNIQILAACKCKTMACYDKMCKQEQLKST